MKNKVLLLIALSFAWMSSASAYVTYTGGLAAGSPCQIHHTDGSITNGTLFYDTFSSHPWRCYGAPGKFDWVQGMITRGDDASDVARALGQLGDDEVYIKVKAYAVEPDAAMDRDGTVPVEVKK